MWNTRNRFLVIALSAYFALGHLQGQAQSSAELRAASLLFNQFETVAYARADFLSRIFALSFNDVDSAANLGQPFVEFNEGLKALGPNAKNTIEKSYGAVLVGARDFLPPEGLGAVISRKCYVGLLQGAPPNLEPDFRLAIYESVEGRQVWTWTIPPPQGALKPTKFYAAQIADSYFLMANNREDFQEAARTLTSAAISNQMPVAISGWEAFSAYSYWAYRSLRQSGVTKSNGGGANDIAPSVTAIVFFANVDTREGFMRVLSSDKSMKTIPKVLPAPELNRLQPRGAGIWQATLPLSKNQAASETLFHVFYHLGFGANL